MKKEHNINNTELGRGNHATSTTQNLDTARWEGKI
jgi:hypothetical protein